MKTIMRAAAIILVLGVPACSEKGFNAQVEPRPVAGVDWTPYQTWSFGRQGEYVVTGNEILDEPTFRKSVGEHTIKEMNDLGYQHVNEAPDLLFMYHVMVEDRFDEVKMNPAYQDFDMQWAHASEDDTWREGTLAIIVVDAKTGKQIWGSVARAELAREPNVSTAKQRFKDVVSEMLTDFPKRTR